MPVYTEKIKNKITGKLCEKKIDNQKVYYIRTYVKDEFGNAKQITKHNRNWIGREGEKEAQREEIRLQNSIYQASIISTNIVDEITFYELFLKKCEYDELYNKNSLSTRKSYEDNLKNHVFPLIGDKNIYSINQRDIISLISYLKKYKKKNGKPLCIRFINEIIHTTKSILNFGVEYYDLNSQILKYLCDVKKDRDTITKIDPIELLKKQSTLSPKDWEKIVIAMKDMIDEAPNDKKEFVKRMMMFFTTEYILMTRVGETQAITYSNLMINYKIYYLCEAYNKRLKKITPTKNRKDRILYIPDTLLNAFIKMYKEDSKKTDFNETDFIFGKDKVFPRTTIDRYRKKLLEKAGVEYLTNHELRHAGISNAIHNEVDASAVADMAGHDKEIMFKTYVQTLKEANTEFINILDKIKVPKL